MMTRSRYRCILVLVTVILALVLMYQYEALLDPRYGDLFSNLRNRGSTLNFRTLSVLVDVLPLRENVIEVGESVKEKITITVENRVDLESKHPKNQRQALSMRKNKRISSTRRHMSVNAEKQNYFNTSYPPPIINGYTCSDSLCSEFLSNYDKRMFYRTARKTITYLKEPQPTLMNGPCHFINGTGRLAVALASFPGSGNTWVRRLLEKATGVCTGSVYLDSSLRLQGFNGDTITSGSVLVVKTHHTDSAVPWTNTPGAKGFSGAVLVVRNLFHALVSEWTRLKTHSHTEQASTEKFSNDKNWDTFVNTMAKRWGQYFDLWLINNHTHPTIMIRYEDLKTDLVGNVERILDFLKFPYDKNQLEKILTEDFTTFKRKHTGGTQEHFTAEQKAVVRTAISQAVTFLRDNNYGDTMHIEDYLS